ncbi:ferritin [Prevotella multiformis]|uniref:Ferritin n=1 Tax=Prevotella multiformis DSM 16608 TaxID=888743 RepID=F0F6E3_9BACT|nr:ferritin [Prevotella multiformis]EGC20225.1 ferritin [Prevotella multiformis DSM 16608]
MNMTKKMQDAFNAQIAAEMWSSNLYLQMAFWFRKEGWKGFSSWMFKQSEEERQHAMDMAQFVLRRGGEVCLTAIEAVKTSWADAKEAFVDTLAHEQNVTGLINRLADVADEEKDRASQNFIAKYIDEQVEEERNVQDILDSFAHLSSHAVAHIDSHLAQRQ